METQYLNMLEDILFNGRKIMDRTGVGTLSIFGAQMKFSLQDQFPLLTTKKIFWKGPVIELFWMLRGETNTKFLNDFGITIWNEWSSPSGDLGPVYGKQIRDFNGTDQLKTLLERIKTNPNCRRLIISMWNPAELKDMALPPCPVLIQFDVHDGKLSSHLYQRSADMFLGVPFDLASYSLLTYLIAKECGLEPYEFTYSFGNAHIYLNHIEQVKEQLKRKPLPFPKLEINFPTNLMDLINVFHKLEWNKGEHVSIQDIISLKDYSSHPSIKAEVAV